MDSKKEVKNKNSGFEVFKEKHKQSGQRNGYFSDWRKSTIFPLFKHTHFRTVLLLLKGRLMLLQFRLIYILLDFFIGEKSPRRTKKHPSYLFPQSQ